MTTAFVYEYFSKSSRRSGRQKNYNYPVNWRHGQNKQFFERVAEGSCKAAGPVAVFNNRNIYWTTANNIFALIRITCRSYRSYGNDGSGSLLAKNEMPNAESVV